MKRVLSFASLIFTLAFAVSVAGQAPAKIASDADYMAHMKEIGPLNGALGKAIKGENAAEATKAAARLEQLFTNIHGYWNAKKVDDATNDAQTAVTSIQQVQKALAANDMAAAEAARAKFASTCGSCHKAHREKSPDGGWIIK